MVLRCDRQELIQSHLEACRVLLPKLVLEEDPHRVHSDTLSHAEFLVVQARVEGGGLEHLQLVDGIGGNKVRADKPGLLSVPGGRLFVPTNAPAPIAEWRKKLQREAG